jgi:mono/diheme cytochrome c family protein
MRTLVKLFWLSPLIAVATTAPAAAANPEHGLEVAEHWCDSCHVIHQRDPGWHSGNVAPRFSMLTKITPDDMRKLLRADHGGIDAIKTLPDADIDDMTAHIRRLKPEEQ